MFLKGLNNESLEALNMISNEDVYQHAMEDIRKLCHNYSWRISKSITITMKMTTSVTNIEMDNMLEYLISEMLSSLAL